MPMPKTYSYKSLLRLPEEPKPLEGRMKTVPQVPAVILS